MEMKRNVRGRRGEAELEKEQKNTERKRKGGSTLEIFISELLDMCPLRVGSLRQHHPSYVLARHTPSPLKSMEKEDKPHY